MFSCPRDGEKISAMEAVAHVFWSWRVGRYKFAFDEAVSAYLKEVGWENVDVQDDRQSHLRIKHEKTVFYKKC